TPMSEALRFIESLLEASGVEQPVLGPEWPELRALCIEKALSANDVPDAWLAAAAIHQGEHVVSFDADFRHLLSRAQFTRLRHQR
ncbi:MAG TPA: VapC toxin family PIN domain ribonuclease, partial [Variovorax sp.]